MIYDKAMTNEKHIRTIARKAAAKLTCLGRITWVVGTGALEMLYKAQIRSTMEFALLSAKPVSPQVQP